MKGFLRIAPVLLLNLCITLCMGQGNYVPPKIPGKYENELKEAVMLSKGGQSEQAIHIITGIISKYPKWADPRRELGRIYYETAQKQEAITQLETIVAMDTLTYLQDLYTLGRIYEDVT